MGNVGNTTESIVKIPPVIVSNKRTNLHCPYIPGCVIVFTYIQQAQMKVPEDTNKYMKAHFYSVPFIGVL